MENVFSALTVALAQSEGPAKGIDDAVGVIQKFASVDIPDFLHVRKALTAWDIQRKDPDSTRKPSPGTPSSRDFRQGPLLCPDRAW